LVTASPAQDDEVLYDVLEAAHSIIDNTIRELTDGEYSFALELQPPEAFRATLTGLVQALQGGDLTALAEWLPASEDLMAALDAIPALHPYADWLRQRIDYAEVAAETTRPPPRKTPATAPHPPAPPPATVHQGPTWDRKLARRPVPSRAQALVPRLKTIFEDAGIPPELVWIAEVESTFNPQARSPAGAVGLFQLMPRTAESLGLQVKPNDQRMDPMQNARAAAAYLKMLHRRFDDWPLAIAAYNGGQGRVGKLLKQRGAVDFEGIAAHLPNETRMYVPKVFATIAKREGINPARLSARGQEQPTRL